MKVVSGGQTGVDRAALDIALELGIPCGGWCPFGRIAEDGPISNQYPLEETPSREFSQRTEWNVRDSDGTLVFSWGAPEGGTQFTIECSEKLKKPLYVVDMLKPTSAKQIVEWMRNQKVNVLNIAGPRESLKPGEIYKTATSYLKDIFVKLSPK